MLRTYAAATLHYMVEALALALLVLIAAVVLPVLGACRLARWAELRTVYGGDEMARDRALWRG